MTPYEGERIAKHLARAGVCSRRDAERLIHEGRVKVDGQRLTTPAFNVTAVNRITVDGCLIQAPQPPRLWRYHKPAGVITTTRDPKGRPTVFERLPPTMPRVVSVGRLDFNTEGLLLLTNNGKLSRHLELPSNAWLRYYRVRVYGRLEPGPLKQLEKYVTISGIHYGPLKITIESTKTEGANLWLSVGLREGKNREIRKVTDHLGLKVTRLIRVSFGPFVLGKLAVGTVEEVPRKALRGALGNYFKVLEG